MQLLSKPFLFMFDPYHIGPGQSTSYDRNNGRVIRRRVINTPSRSWTRNELMELLPLMQMNGLLPSVSGALTFNSVIYTVYGRAMSSASVSSMGNYELPNNLPVVFYYTPGDGFLYFCVLRYTDDDGYMLLNDTGHDVSVARGPMSAGLVEAQFSSGNVFVMLHVEAIIFASTNSSMSNLPFTRVPWNGAVVP